MVQSEKQEENKKNTFPKDLGPSNGRVWTCIRGRVLKIASFEGPMILRVKQIPVASDYLWFKKKQDDFTWCLGSQ